MQSVREFLDTRTGKYSAMGFLAVVGIVAVFAMKSFFGMSPAEAATRDRMFICSETEKAFRFTVDKGVTIPVHSPYSGKDTGYPAELCYWTRDGKPKTDPTPVLLNSYKNVAGPTFCPDCGCLVVGHNPVPDDNSKTPPTRQEYEARQAAKEQLRDQQE
ncbi:MAG: hypothetical protein JWO87_1355 [Phycisphaerales bacterium]|nr:hypothetical protein [Phycisphaerales bacterium]